MAHASTHPAHPLPPVAPRRLLLAQRLLRGEGSVEVTAFRAGETLTTAVHGVSAEGRLVVAHVPNLLGSLGAFHTPAPLDVRVDVLRDALDLTLPTRLASVHLLGTLRWCRDSAEVAELGLRGRVADLVADVGPRVRVGVVETQRILLHDVDGVAVFCRHTLPLTSRGLIDQAELELRIVRLTVPDLDKTLAASVVRLVGALREMRLRKSPSVAETIDWARTLVSLGTGGELQPELVRATLGVVLKHREDIELAVQTLDLDRALA